MRSEKILQKLWGKYHVGQIYVRAAAVLCAAFGWWGMLYPELTLTPDTYRVVYEGTHEECGGADYRELFSAKPGQIRLRSKLYAVITQWLEDSNK